MRFILVTLFCVLLCSSLTFAQMPGSIGLFFDQYGAECSADEVPGVTLNVWVVHVYTSGASASEFRVETPPCLLYVAEFVGELFIALGGFRDGISIAYNGCYISPIVLGYIMFLSQGACPQCTYMRVVDHPSPSTGIPGIWMYDCSLPPNPYMATGGEFIINPQPECDCDIPVKETTWGQIKALY